MTLDQISSLHDKAVAPVILAIGAIEQHGPHLPVAVDALLGEAFVTMALERLAPEVACYVAPPITVGKSNEHTGYPGSLILSRKTLQALVLAVGQQLHAWGFKALGILNTHGGNTAVVAATLREVTARYGIRTEFITSNAQLELSPRERTFGYHANEVETAWVLALAAKHVRIDRAVCDYFGEITGPGELRAEQSAATFAWTTQDMSRTGVMGDASAGTLEKGLLWLPQVAQGYAESITRLHRALKDDSSRG